MSKSVDVKVAVVIPNWNGADSLEACLDSVLDQSLNSKVIVVDNGSVDDSLDILKEYPQMDLIRHSENKGFAGGVNAGIQLAIDSGCKYVALLNNDAVADKGWLDVLVSTLEESPKTGIVTSKILSADGKSLDSTGDYYTTWGLPYPRGRGETDINKYDDQTNIFAASGGASLYRVSMLDEIGLFDEDFFAYYEDVDISFRAQLASWKVLFAPKAVVYHQIGATSGKIKGFSTYQTIKNQPLLLTKNVPRKYFWKVGSRFMLAHFLFFIKAIARGHGWAAIKGDFTGTLLLISASKKRKEIQANKKVPDEYIWSMLVHDLPPNARNLRRLRAFWRKITGKRVS